MNDGGCLITGYALFRDDGSTGTPTTEINSASDVNIRNKPSLREATISGLTSGDLGKTYTIKLTVFTAIGSYDSANAQIKFATKPGTPTTAPADDTSITNSK